jgi:uncharacterized protein (DUF924 family)
MGRAKGGACTPMPDRLTEPASTEAPWVADVLAFWFGELDRKAWFRKDEATDHAIRRRFHDTYEKVARLPAAQALTSPQCALATVIVLDQFPRNMFRGTPKAFATDPLAREVARGAVERKLDEALDKDARAFLYLPFEHSESLADQERAVALISRLGDAEYTRYAIAHRDVIARFGRFPHRNVVLGRTSTPEETAFLREPGSSF